MAKKSLFPQTGPDEPEAPHEYCLGKLEGVVFLVLPYSSQGSPVAFYETKRAIPVPLDLDSICDRDHFFQKFAIYLRLYFLYKLIIGTVL